MKTHFGQLSTDKTSRGKGLHIAAVTMTLGLTLLLGCTTKDTLPGSIGPTFPSPSYSRYPYDGRGLVRRVSNGRVSVAFEGDPYPSHYGMTLLVVHDGKLIGKLKLVSCCEKGLPAELTEGSVRVGDTVVGCQHAHEYTKAY